MTESATIRVAAPAAVRWPELRFSPATCKAGWLPYCLLIILLLYGAVWPCLAAEYDPATYPVSSGAGVLFRVPAAGHTDVRLSGSFNDWDADGILLKKSGAFFSAVVPLPPGNTYQYKFKIDGAWQTDPGNPQQQKNAFGNRFSVITLDAAGQVLLPPGVEPLLPVVTEPEVAPPGTGSAAWQGQYFNNPDLSGLPVLSREEGRGFLNFNWQGSSPGEAVNSDYFSALWTRTIDCPAPAVYDFALTSDDGARLYLDRQLLIDGWQYQAATLFCASVYLTRGRHTLEAEYFEGGGQASYALEWGVHREQTGGRSLGGIVSLPKQAAGLKTDLALQISALAADNRAYTSLINIPAGKRTAAFTIPLPAGLTACRLRYTAAGSPFVATGYYGSSGTTARLQAAATINLAQGTGGGINLELIPGVVLTGTLHVPQAAVAAGGVVILQAANGSGEQYSAAVTLAPGKQAVPYSLTLPRHESFTKCYLKYTARFNNRLYREGYYGREGTDPSFDAHDWLDLQQGEVSGVDLQLLPAAVVSGRLLLPAGFKAPAGGLRMAVVAFDETVGVAATYGSGFHADFFIPAGERTTPYSLSVPLLTGCTRFHVGYQHEYGRYWQDAYYSKQGMMPHYRSSRADWIELGDGDRGGIDLQLVRDEAVLSFAEQQEAAAARAVQIAAENITGSMTDFERVLVLHDYLAMHGYYDDGVVNGEQGYWANNFTSNYNMLINGRGDCGAFSRSLAALLNAAGVEAYAVTEYLGHVWNKIKVNGQFYLLDITYNDQGKEKFHYGYFLLSGAQLYKSHSSYISAPGVYADCNRLFRFQKSDYTGKKAALATDYRRIMGTLSLPAGETAPAGGLELKINGSPFFLPAGESRLFYMLPVFLKEAGSSTTVEYRLESGGGYLSAGYYGGAQTVAEKAQAAAINLERGDSTGIDLTLLKGSRFLAGTVSLPPGRSAPAGGQEVSVGALEKEWQEEYWCKTLIPAGGRSAAYTLYLPETAAGKEFRVRYAVSGEAYVSSAYYGTGRTVASHLDAVLVAPVRQQTRGIDLQLEEGFTISGQVSPPGKGRAASEINGTLYYYQYFTHGYYFYYSVARSIKAGSSGFDYSFRVSADEQVTGYRIKFVCGTPGYATEVYYSAGGTTTDGSRATDLPATKGDLSRIDLVLLRAE